MREKMLATPHHKRYNIRVAILEEKGHDHAQQEKKHHHSR